MDLHLTSAVATDEERAAVDALLGPPETGLGRRRPRRRRRDAVRARRPRGARAAGPAAARAARAAVRRRMDQRGRPELRLPAADRAAGRGVRRRDVLRDVQRRTAARGPWCTSATTSRAGVGRRRALRRAGAHRRPAGDAREGDAATWVRSPCLGMCERAPAVLVQRRARRGRRRVRARVGGAGRRLARRDRTPSRSSRGRPIRAVAVARPRPGTPRRGPACGCCGASGVVDPASIDDYRAHGGYEALRRALELGPEGVIREVTDAQADGPRRRRVPDRA